MTISDDQAIAAFNILAERAEQQRRKTGTIIAVTGRSVSVLLDGEGASVLSAYRGTFEPAIGAGVTIERTAGTNYWRVVGIRDSALGTIQSSQPYDLELQGNILYYPLALEAINDVSFSVGSGMNITLYNVQFMDTDGVWHYLDSYTLDLDFYVPGEDSLWAIIYADRTNGLLGVYAHTTVADADGKWPAAVNGMLASVSDALPVLAIWLDADMTEWGDAWKVIKRGYSFDGKRIVRIPFSSGSTDVESSAPGRQRVIHGDISSDDDNLTLDIPELNVQVILDRVGSADPKVDLVTQSGSEDYDYRVVSVTGASTVAATDGTGDEVTLSTTPTTVDAGVSMDSDDTLTITIRRISTSDVWQIGVFISAAGARATIWASPAGVFSGGTMGWLGTPPTNSELDTAFGSASTVGAGFTGMIDDSDDEANLIYFVASDGDSWWYMPMRPAT